MKAKFILANGVLLAAVIALAQLSFEPLTQSPWPHWAAHFLFVWLFLASLGGYLLVESKLRAKPKDFVNTFMLASGLRMMVSILIVVFLVLYFPGNGQYISVYYVSAYLLFLVVEVSFLFRRSKQVK